MIFKELCNALLEDGWDELSCKFDYSEAQFINRKLTKKQILIIYSESFSEHLVRFALIKNNETVEQYFNVKISPEEFVKKISDFCFPLNKFKSFEEFYNLH